MARSRPFPAWHSLTELASLKKALSDQARELARQVAEAREKALRLERERQLFALTVGPVTPLPPSSIRTEQHRRAAPIPKQRELDEAAVLHEAWSDDFDVESLLDTDAALSFRRRGVGPEVVRKLRRGVWATQAQIDLHGMRREQAREALALFLRESSNHGLRCVRVIHGKGNGSPGRESVLKIKVRGWLVQKDEVMAFVQARASDGGHGALMVLLKPTLSSRVNPTNGSSP